jgi:transcriptional regulator with XRE-family HTH domain
MKPVKGKITCYAFFMNISKFLKELIDQGVTQEAIAAKVGLGQGTIHNLVNGFGTPRISTLMKIARAYGKTPGFFMSEYVAENQETYTTPEQRLLEAFRKLDPGRQKELIEYAEYKAHQVGPHGIGGRDSGLDGQNCA